MSDGKLSRLLSEYQTNLILWQHDDNLRQQRYGTFLSINSLLIVALGGLVTLAPATSNLIIVAILMSLFGFPVCILWDLVQIRNAEYIRFRRYQLRSIEAQLPPMTTFANQWKALNEFKTVTFDHLDDKFTIKARAKKSSTTIEGTLPLIIACFWLLVFLGGISITILRLLQIII